MRDTTLYKVSGGALLAGGVISTVAHVVHPSEPTDAASVVHFMHTSPGAHLLLFAGIMLVFLGMPGWYAQQRESTGAITLAAAVVIFIGMVCSDFIHCSMEFGLTSSLRRLPVDQASAMYLDVYHNTPFGMAISVGSLVLWVAVLLYLVASRKSKATSRWARILWLGFLLCLVGTYLPVVSPYAGKAFVICFYLGWSLYGLEMMSRLRGS